MDSNPILAYERRAYELGYPTMHLYNYEVSVVSDTLFKLLVHTWTSDSMKDYYVYENRPDSGDNTTSYALLAGLVGLLGFNSDDEDD